MKVLFVVSAWAGHYSCMVPLGWALQAAGHDVRVAVAPPAADAVSRSGLTVVPVLDTLDLNVITRMMYYQEATDGTRTLPGLPLHPLTGEPVSDLSEFDFATDGLKYFEGCEAAVRRSYDGCVEFARSWRPDLVVYDLMSAEGALAATLIGVPSVYFPPGLFGTTETEPGVNLGDGDPSGSWPRYGQEPWHGSQIEYVIDPSPAGALPPAGDALRIPIRYIPYNGAAVVPDWLRRPAAGTRACILWGNSATGGFGPDLPVLPYAIEAAACSAEEVVLSANEKQVDALGPLPPNVRVLRNFPLHLLLAVSDLFIHHGSTNTAMNAAATGVPQVSLALNDEQKTVSGRMASTGVSRVVPGLSASAEEVRDAVKTVLGDPSYRRAAEKVREGIAAQTAPATVVPMLEHLARTGRLDRAEMERISGHPPR